MPSPKTATETYTRIHKALVKVGRSAGIRPFAARVVLAIGETHDLDGGPAVRSDRLEEVLGAEGTRPELRGSDIRRALSELYRSGHVAGQSSADGGRRRQGVRTDLRLTKAGVDVYRLLRAELDGILG